MRSRPTRRSLALASFAAVAVVAAGVGVTSFSRGPVTSRTPLTLSGAGPSPAEKRPPSWPDSSTSGPSEAGAVAAAAQFAVAFDGLGLLDAESRTGLLERHAASASVRELAVSLQVVAETVTDALNADGFEGPESVWRVVPAGWRVVSYSHDAAEVAIWETGVLILGGMPLTQPGWRTTYVALVWERGEWRLAGFRSEDGPEPPAVGGTSDAAAQARLINLFHPFTYQPADVAGERP